tara:strand:+ start:2691 stop:3935 length:1245 start_codon:yes stop_codon:yes gene_type:complete
MSAISKNLGRRCFSINSKIAKGKIDVPNSLPFNGQVQVLSDLHLDYKKWKGREVAPEIAVGENAKFLVLAGDIGNPISKIYNDFLKNVCKIFEHVVLVPGNHEFYEQEYYEAVQILQELETKHDRLSVLQGPEDEFMNINMNMDMDMDMDMDMGNLDPHKTGRLERHAGSVYLELDKPIDIAENSNIQEHNILEVIGTTMWSWIYESSANKKENKYIEEYCNTKFGDYRRIKLDHGKFTVNHSNELHKKQVKWIADISMANNLNPDLINFQKQIQKQEDANWTNVFGEAQIDQLSKTIQEPPSDQASKLLINNMKRLIVTHHAPLVQEVCNPKYLGLKSDGSGKINRLKYCNYAFCTDLSDLIINIKPDAWVFGHTHYPVFQQYHGRTLLVNNPAGKIQGKAMKRLHPNTIVCI